MAHNVRDAAILLRVLAGHDPRDPRSLRDVPPDFLDGLDGGARGLRLAWSTDLGYAVIDPEVVAITSVAARVFEELGCAVEDPSLVLNDPVPAFRAIFHTSNYATYGHLLEDSADQLTENTLNAFEYGGQVTGADFARAIREVDLMREQLDDLMDDYDLLLTPTMAVPPFPIGQLPDRIGDKEVDPRFAYSPMTRPFNLCGQPAASIPCGFSSDGLPIGLHIIGRRGEESTVLRAAAAFEQARPWRHRRPPID